MRVPILVLLLVSLLALGSGCRRECDCPVDCSTTGGDATAAAAPPPGPALASGASVAPGSTVSAPAVGPASGTTVAAAPLAEKEYCASENGEVFHRCSCTSVKRIKPGKLVRFSSRAEALASGRRPCKQCKP